MSSPCAGTRAPALNGSFVTAKPYPNDVYVFMLMDDDFDVSHVTDEAAIVFDHVAAQNYEGASVFWAWVLTGSASS